MRSRGLLDVVRGRWRWIAVGALLGLVAAGAWTFTAPTTYRATSTVFFSLEFGNSASELVQGSTYTQDQVASFALLANTPAVLQPVVAELHLPYSAPALSGHITASAPANTAIIHVSATDTDAAASARLANAVVTSLSQVVEGVAPRNAQGKPTVRAVTVAPAQVPTAPSSPKVPLDLAVGLVAGLLAGLAGAYARERLDTRVRDADVVAQLTPLPVIASIPARKRDAGHPVLAETDPHGAHAEAFRHLRTNLQFFGLPADVADGAGGVQVVSVTSALSAEGKSTVAANLARVLAETGARVLLMDADLRRPAIARLLGLEGAVGLTTVVLGRASVADVVQEWGTAGLHVLPAGSAPPNPSELLGSRQMAALLRDLRARYDYVVIDTPPVLPVADAVILSRQLDGTLIVANVTRAHRRHLTEALRSLEQVGGRVLGIVLNQVRREEETYRYDGDGDPGWDVLPDGEPMPRIDDGRRPPEPERQISPSVPMSQPAATAVRAGGQERCR
ncbi:MAG: capsular exopolysaccharide family [Streptosporangiaceae bacterium]|nr:capsular exopolysaccharide family [Streptosporangiaceae bacterium]